MKVLFYIAPVAAVAGAWMYFRQPEPAPPPVLATRVSPPAQLISEPTRESTGETLDLGPDAMAADLRPPFSVKVYVRRLFAGWQRLQFAEGDVHQQGLRRELRRDVEAVKARLYAEGLFSEGAVRRQMLKAAEELGHRPEEARYVVNQVLSLAKADKESESGGPPKQKSGGLPPGF